jgi:cytoskeletal protein RodZ
MENLARRATESEDLLRAMLERSERRLVILVSLLVLLMLGVLAGGLYLGMTGRVQVQVVERPHIEQAAEALVKPSVAALSPEPEVQEEAVPMEKHLAEPEGLPAETALEPAAPETVAKEKTEQKQQPGDGDSMESVLVPEKDDSAIAAEDASEEDADTQEDDEETVHEEEGIFRRRGFIFFGGD